MAPILRALRLFGRERGLWKFALRPLGWAALAYLLVLVLVTGVGERIGEAVGRGSALGGLIGAGAGLILTIFLGGGIYLALVALISGFGFDRLSAEVERREFGGSVGQPLGFTAGLGDGIGRGVLSAVLGVVALCTSPTVVIPWILAAFLCLMDFTAPSLLRRGVGFSRQFGTARRIPGALAFAAVCGVVVLIPVVNVLALPVLVSAGTILVAEGGASFQEASSSVPPASSR